MYFLWRQKLGTGADRETHFLYILYVFVDVVAKKRGTTTKLASPFF